MLKAHAAAIVAGLAVGAFIGYEWAASLTNTPPYSWINNWITGNSASSGS
jgi:hypothetical protein